MATSPNKYKSSLLSPILGAKSKLANRLSANRKSYGNFESSPSIDEFENLAKPDLAINSLNLSPQIFFSTPESIPSPNLATYNDYLYTKKNCVLFHIQFTNVHHGFFKDIINLNTPVQDLIERYSQFFQSTNDTKSLDLFVGPKIGVYSKLKFSRIRSIGAGFPRKLSTRISLAEQNVSTSHVLIIGPPPEANLNKEIFCAYLNSKSEHTEFVERWLPAVQGYVPLNEDDACVVAALLFKLSLLQNLDNSKLCPKDFIHSSVQITKLADTKIEKALDRVRDEPVESVMKICQDTILGNFLSAAIIFSVSYSTGAGLYADQPAYLVISSQTILLVKKSDPTKIIFNIQLTDAKSWKYSGKFLDIKYMNKCDQSSSTPLQSSHFVIKSQDSPAISSTLTAVGYALAHSEDSIHNC